MAFGAKELGFLRPYLQVCVRKGKCWILGKRGEGMISSSVYSEVDNFNTRCRFNVGDT